MYAVHIYYIWCYAQLLMVLVRVALYGWAKYSCYINPRTFSTDVFGESVLSSKQNVSLINVPALIFDVGYTNFSMKNP